jgi:hypothetical protein
MTWSEAQQELENYRRGSWIPVATPLALIAVGLFLVLPWAVAHLPVGGGLAIVLLLANTGCLIGAIISSRQGVGCPGCHRLIQYASFGKTSPVEYLEIHHSCPFCHYRFE